jgi:hypothetical protein
MLSCSNWVTPINDAAALRAYGDNARPSRALPEAPNRCRVNEGGRRAGSLNTQPDPGLRPRSMRASHSTSSMTQLAYTCFRIVSIGDHLSA